jgi:hypothetical protein
MLAATGSPGREGTPMPALYYQAVTENGYGWDDPSDDGLFLMIDELNHIDNTFVVIRPDTEDPTWFAAIVLLEDGGYAIELRDRQSGEHQRSVQQDISRIARDVTRWMVDRAVATDDFLPR